MTTFTRPSTRRTPRLWKRFPNRGAPALGALGLAGALLAPAAPGISSAEASVPGLGDERAAEQSAHHTERVPGQAQSAVSATDDAAGDTTAFLFQWTWGSVARACEQTLGPAGYGAVQTSPPQEHITGDQWWVHYQPVSYQLESRLGTRADYAAMVQTCHDAGVEVIADVVINHMTGQESGTGWAGSAFTHYDYPGTYSRADFHDHGCEVQDYTDRWEVQECDLVGLADLNTGADYVQSRLADYLDDLSSLGVDGFRIDAAKHIAAADLEGILSRTDGIAAEDIVQEVIRGAGEPIQPEEYTDLGDVHEFSYARKLKESFGGGRIDWLLSGGGIGEDWDGFIPSEKARSFVENHDTERNGETLTAADGDVHLLAQAFTLGWDYGEPTVFSGYSVDDYDAGPPTDADGHVVDAVCGEGPWTCTHARTEVTGMVGFRDAVGDAPVTDTWTGGEQSLAFGRGEKGFLAINRAPSGLDASWQTSLPAGEYCDVYSGVPTASGCSGETLTVAADGTVSGHVTPTSALALHVDALAGTGSGDGSGDDSTETSRELVLYYAADWDTANVHYQVGDGAWTEVPGEAMTAACTGWFHTDISLGEAEEITAAFNDGAGTWDNNEGSDYTIGSGVQQVADGTVTAGSPC